MLANWQSQLALLARLQRAVSAHVSDDIGYDIHGPGRQRYMLSAACSGRGLGYQNPCMPLTVLLAQCSGQVPPAASAPPSAAAKAIAAPAGAVPPAAAQVALPAASSQAPATAAPSATRCPG